MHALKLLLQSQLSTYNTLKVINIGFESCFDSYSVDRIESLEIKITL